MKNVLKICVIDDSVIVRDLLAFTIESNIDCTVHSVNLTRPFEDILKAAPDVIILDYSLDCDQLGFDSLSLLKQFNQTLADIPVIIFSGQTDLSIASNLIKKGAVDYVSKNSLTFHDDIILSVKNALEIRMLSKQKKVQKKKQFNRLKKIVSLSIIIGSLLILILTN
jgi:two-component system response regulator HydG